MGRKSVSALKRKMHFVIRAWLEEAVIRCNGSSFFMLYQHPTPTPKSPLSPRGDFDSSLPLDALVLVSVALCDRQPGCATAPYSRSLCSPFAGAKRWG